MEEEDPRQRAIALLESQHAFPGEFEFRVVIRPPAKAAALGAVLAVTGGSVSLVAVTERPSANGNYLALRIRARVAADRGARRLRGPARGRGRPHDPVAVSRGRDPRSDRAPRLWSRSCVGRHVPPCGGPGSGWPPKWLKTSHLVGVPAESIPAGRRTLARQRARQPAPKSSPPAAASTTIGNETRVRRGFSPVP